MTWRLCSVCALSLERQKTEKMSPEVNFTPEFR